MVFYTLVSQFYLKNGEKGKREWYISEEKNGRKIKQCQDNDIFTCKRDSFSRDAEITRRIV